MSPEPPAQPDSLKDITGGMVKKLAAGVSQDKLIDQLVARGWPLIAARQFVANLARTVQQRDDVAEDHENLLEEYRSRIVRDFVACLTTVTLLLLSVTFFESLDVIALVFLGLSAFSLIDMVIAFIAFMRARK